MKIKAKSLQNKELVKKIIEQSKQELKNADEQIKMYDKLRAQSTANKITAQAIIDGLK